MRMSKRCEKCGKSSEVEASDTAAACAHCGAIFAKVEAAQAARQRDPGPATRPGRTEPRASQFKESTTRVPFASGDRPFLADLRAGTNYPTFRATVNFFYWFWIVLAAIMVIGALISYFGEEGSWTSAGIGFLLAALFVFLGRLLREVSMMLADIGDATIRTAQRAAVVPE